jgi:hypothetical protein
MRALISVLLVALLTFGCAHTGQRSQASWERATAAELGITRKEVAEIARNAVGNRRLVVMFMKKADDGIVDVYLAETLNDGSGTVARFRKVADKWVELDTNEIIKWME